MRSAFEELQASRDKLVSLFMSGKVSENLQQVYSEIVDNYFRTNVQESNAGQAIFQQGIPFSLIAVGGYGREELCLYSDIDVVILFHKRIPKKAKDLAEEIFYPLWDLGFELGYGVRTIKDCVTLCKDNFEVITSMLDARFICGDSLLYLTLMEELYKKVVKKSTATFVRWLEDIDKIRMESFGDASHLLEPNLKEGIGGLRDYHHILWTAKMLFNIRNPDELEYSGKLSHQEYGELKKSVDFILLVRNHLHQLSERKNDRLNFEYQEQIAGRLGHKNQKNIRAVEQFLSLLHSHMESIKTLRRSFIVSHTPKRNLSRMCPEPRDMADGLHVIHNELNFKSARNILDDPLILLKVFKMSSDSGYPLSIEARRLVKEFSHIVDDEFMRSEKAIQDFLSIINSKRTKDTIDQMSDTGFLDAFIPEFGKIRNRVQFDAYHLFPVGRHALETLSNLKDIPNGEDLFLSDVFSDIKNHEPLFLAGLFHDIGKTGKGHSKRGAKLTKKILERFNYPAELTEDIVFLVENHLLLAETAARRDLNDEKIIIQCARVIGDIERLKSLYLLTWADSKATGPRAWNDWISNLIQELFFKILHILESGELATPDSSQKASRIKANVKRRVTGLIVEENLEKYFEIMSPRYMLNTNPAAISRHLEMVELLKKDKHNNSLSSFILDVEEDKQAGVFEISLVAKDRPGIFSDITGVMALNNINILSSHIYTWRDGTVVDIFSVSRPLDYLHSKETWARVRKNLKETFDGKLSLPYRLSKKAEPTILSKKIKPTLPPEIIVDNRTSDFFTIIEVYASDRVGLLFLITRTLFDLHLDIRIAKTGVKGDQTADIFYVRDLEGQKLEDEDQVNEVKNALLYQLSK